MMSPRRSVARTRLASARCAEARLRDAPRSASVSRRRIAAYSMKSPRSQLTCLARSAACSLRRRSRRARPTTPRSAWNWAKLDSSSAAALRPADLGGEVDRHVVGRAEGGVQRVGTGARQAGHRARVEARLPQHDRVALDVDAAAARPAGELGVLAGGERDVGLAVPLVELLEHHGPRGHVDAEGEGLGGEHRLDQARGEQLLDDLLEDRQQPGVVGGDAAAQREHPVVVAEDGQVLVGEVGGAPGRDVLDDPRLVGRGQPQARGQALLHGGVAAGPAEDEGDRGQQALPRRAGR